MSLITLKMVSKHIIIVHIMDFSKSFYKVDRNKLTVPNKNIQIIHPLTTRWITSFDYNVTPNEYRLGNINRTRMSVYTLPFITSTTQQHRTITNNIPLCTTVIVPSLTSYVSYLIT